MRGTNIFRDKIGNNEKRNPLSIPIERYTWCLFFVFQLTRFAESLVSTRCGTARQRNTKLPKYVEYEVLPMLPVSPFSWHLVSPRVTYDLSKNLQKRYIPRIS